MATDTTKKSKNLVKEETTAYAVPSDLPPAHGGRPRVFPGPTLRLNLFLPEDTVKRIRHLAVDQGKSPSQLVDGWARRAELDWAVSRGLEAVTEGRVVDLDEMERRLATWS